MPEFLNNGIPPLEFVIKTFEPTQNKINQDVIEKIKEIFATGGIPVKIIHKKEKPER